MKKNNAGYCFGRQWRKLLFVMKFVWIFIMAGFVSANAAKTYSQTVRFDLKMKNASLKSILSEIEEKTEFNFFYKNDEIEKLTNLTVEANQASVSEVLDGLLRDKGLEYEVYDRYILIQKSGDRSSVSGSTQQQISVSGRVTDASGSTLPGVTVVVKGTTSGTITGSDGTYTLSGISADAILLFSFVGKRTQEIPVEGKTTVDVIMDEETVGLEEVVAIGYGTQKKATITGSVSKVMGEKLEIGQPSNFSNSLVGRLPGLITVTNTGIPGDDSPTIRIRGNNTLNDNNPLIVVDGVADRSMSRLSAQDIESVTVLKDASAAIYGSRAANGVILITTKRGTTDKLKTTVTINQGFSSPTVVPDMAPSWLYATMMNEVDTYAGQNPRYSEDDIQKFKDGTNPYTHPNTDWYEEVFKQFSLETNVNVSLRGGTEKLKYFTSIGGRYQDAAFKRSAINYNQFNFRSNIDAKLSDNLSLAIDLAGRQEKRNRSIYSNGVIFRIIPRAKPTEVAWWFGEYPGPDVETDQHPGVMVTDIPGYDKSTDYIFESNLRLSFQVPWVKGLSITGNFSVDKNFLFGKVWQIPFELYTWDKVSYDSDGLPQIVASTRGIAQPQLDQSSSKEQQITANIYINYEKKFLEKHRLKMLVGNESIKGKYGEFSAMRRYFLSEAIDELFAGGDAEKDNSGYSSESARMNYFGRVNYDYSSKYLLEFVWRYDGSYIFPENKRWGFFPGVSLGWVLSEENFWKNRLNFFDFFKLRGSWGQTGNDRVGNFQYLSTYEFGDDWWLYGVEFNTFTTGESTKNKTLYESRIANENITWEVANQFNVGLESKMLESKLTFEANYFYNIRSNILIQRNASVPASAGFTLPQENIGEVVNRGFEFDVGFRNRVGSFNYFVSVNGGYAKDKVTFWDEEPGVPEYQKKEGHPMESELYYQAIGIFRDQAHVDSYPHWTGARPGDIIYKDVNNDETIDGEDRVRDYRGKIPRFVGGLNFDLSYKNFYLTALFQGALGKMRYHYVESGEAGNYYMIDAEGRWTEDNPDVKKPRAFSYTGEYWRDNSSGKNTYWLRSADYIRLKNMELGYHMPQSVNNKLGTTGLRIYISGSNLFTYCPDIQDFDPESTSTYWDYPVHKVFNLGVSVNF